MRPNDRILVNKDGLAEPNARHWQGLEAWEQGYSMVSLPLRRPLVRGIVHLRARQVLGIDLKCSESRGRRPVLNIKLRRSRSRLHRGISIRPMTGWGLGCVKT
jgi:hypothetical protein